MFNTKRAINSVADIKGLGRAVITAILLLLAFGEGLDLLLGELPFQPLGDGHRAVREMGGFLRFAPLPAGALETRLFLPL